MKKSMRSTIEAMSDWLNGLNQGARQDAIRDAVERILTAAAKNFGGSTVFNRGSR